MCTTWLPVVPKNVRPGTIIHNLDCDISRHVVMVFGKDHDGIWYTLSLWASDNERRYIEYEGWTTDDFFHVVVAP